MSRPKILILDDSEVVREMTKEALLARDFDVITLSSGIGFSRALIVDQPDLALVDVNMPALDGTKVIAIARRLRDSICPIVLYSSQRADTLEVLARRCGAAGYIAKNGDWNELVRGIHHFLAAGRRAASRSPSTGPRRPGYPPQS